jgi:hypothetical protein
VCCGGQQCSKFISCTAAVLDDMATALPCWGMGCDVAVRFVLLHQCHWLCCTKSCGCSRCRLQCQTVLCSRASAVLCAVYDCCVLGMTAPLLCHPVVRLHHSCVLVQQWLTLFSAREGQGVSREVRIEIQVTQSAGQHRGPGQPVGRPVLQLQLL